MGQHNTVPNRDVVPGINSANTRSSQSSLKAPVAASQIKSQQRSLTVEQAVNEPCIFRVPSVPYANSKVEVTSEVPTTCSIQLPNSRGLVFENVFLYRNSKDQIVFTSGDRRTLENKLAQTQTGTTKPSSGPSLPTVVDSSAVVAIAAPVAKIDSGNNNNVGLISTCVSTATKLLQAPVLFVWNPIVRGGLPGSGWGYRGLIMVTTATLGVGAVAIYFA